MNLGGVGFLPLFLLGVFAGFFEDYCIERDSYSLLYSVSAWVLIETDSPSKSNPRDCPLLVVILTLNLNIVLYYWAEEYAAVL